MHLRNKLGIAVLLTVSPLMNFGFTFPKAAPKHEILSTTTVLPVRMFDVNIKEEREYQREMHKKGLEKSRFINGLVSKNLSNEVALVAWNGMQACNLNPWFIRDMWQLESRLDPTLVHLNNDGSQDYGLGQINERNIKWLARLAKVEGDVFDPVQNAEMSIAALCYYKSYPEEKGLTGEEFDHALATAYNKGARGADNYYVEEGNNRYHSNYSVAIERISVSRGGTFRARGDS